jgi:aliphatic nitrilase
MIKAAVFPRNRQSAGQPVFQAAAPELPAPGFPATLAAIAGVRRMTKTYPRFKAAACHAAPVFLDAARSIDKACDLIAEAVRNGARLVAFPESFVPGFPVWLAVQAPIHNHRFFAALAAEALTLDHPLMGKLRDAARKHGVVVSLGFTEGTLASVGCLWNSNVLIDSDGGILNLHRKLMPTFYEKLVWAPGDARGLRVKETGIGRIGMLICGENTNPLARFALMAEGEQVHVSSYPPIWPTRPVTNNKRYDLRRAIEVRAAAHAFEAKAFNIVASAAVDDSMRKAVGTEPGLLELIDRSPRGVSMVLGPTGDLVSETLSENEGIVYAEIDVADCIEPKQFHDVVGGYNRFDIFKLEIDRTPREPAHFIDGTPDPAKDAAQ